MIRLRAGSIQLSGDKIQHRNKFKDICVGCVRVERSSLEVVFRHTHVQ